MAADIVSRICSSDQVNSTVFADWSVLVVDENWKHRQRLSKMLTPFFKKIELVFDVTDALTRLEQKDDVIDLILFGVSPTAKETLAWTGNINGLEKKPKVLFCADKSLDHVKDLANLIVADGHLALGEDEGEFLQSVSEIVGADFNMPEKTSENTPEISDNNQVIAEPTVAVVAEEHHVEESHKVLIRESIQIPEPTDVILELRELFQRDKRTRAEEIEAVIDSDYKLKNRILKSVSANFFGVRVKTKLSSISHAINLVGMKPVVNFANLISMNGAAAKRTGKITDFAYKYWKYGLSSGIACVDLHVHMASDLVDFDSSDAFLLGALHNLGILLMAKEFPDEYPNQMSEFWRKHHSGVGQIELERNEFGYDHSQVSALVAQEWQMPEEFQKPILNHHDFAYKLGDKKEVMMHNMLALADYMTNHYLFNNFDFTLLNKEMEPIAKVYGQDLDSLKKMKETIRSQLMANINLIG